MSKCWPKRCARWPATFLGTEVDKGLLPGPWISLTADRGVWFSIKGRNPMRSPTMVQSEATEGRSSAMSAPAHFDEATLGRLAAAGLDPARLPRHVAVII